MKNMKKLFSVLILPLLVGLGSCTTSQPSNNKVKSDTLYVNKVENLTDDFVLGMDTSSVISLEEAGIKYYDFDGEEKDLFKILAGVGVTHIRIRVWNDPFKHNEAAGTKNGYGGGNVDIDRAVAIGKRVTAAGMKCLIDFHYSDFWADPKRQTAPKAWTGFTLEETITALSEYTVASMQKLKDNNVAVDIVQIGNETNIGIAGIPIDEDGSYANFSRIITAGTRAVKQVYPEALTAIHFTDPQRRFYKQLAARLNRQGCEYDIFGTSYYPFYHGTLENLQDQLDSIGRTYHKKVMVLETSYAYTDEDTDFFSNQFSSYSTDPKYYPISPAGQANNFRNICNMVANLRDGHGLGVCYWEGAWIGAGYESWQKNQALWNKYGCGWASKYAAEYDAEVTDGAGGTNVDNQCFFDKDGHALEQLKVFGMMKDGNVTPKYFDGVQDKVEVNFETKDNIVLPSEVNGIYNDDSRVPVNVTWDLSDYGGDPNNINQGDPSITTLNGTVRNGDKDYTTKCQVNLEVSNYVANGSFEDGDDGSWELVNNSSTPYMLKFTAGDAANPSNGIWCCHSYNGIDDEVNYEVKQIFTVNKDITLKLSYYLCGGNAEGTVPTSAQNIYAYFLADGVDMGIKVEGHVESWIDHYQYLSDGGIEFHPGVEYTIGFHIEAHSTGLYIDLDYVNLYE